MRPPTYTKYKDFARADDTHINSSVLIYIIYHRNRNKYILNALYIKSIFHNNQIIINIKNTNLCKSDAREITRAHLMECYIT